MYNNECTVDQALAFANTLREKSTAEAIGLLMLAFNGMDFASAKGLLMLAFKDSDVE